MRTDTYINDEIDVGDEHKSRVGLVVGGISGADGKLRPFDDNKAMVSFETGCASVFMRLDLEHLDRLIELLVDAAAVLEHHQAAARAPAAAPAAPPEGSS